MYDIYFDNAATSFPKPESVWENMQYYMEDVGAPLNRSSYSAATDVLHTAFLLRESLSRLFHHGADASHVVFTSGATASLNMAIKGFLRPGDHVIVSGMEHNAVMRPLTQLARREGIAFDRIPADEEGRMDPEDLLGLIRENTRLLVATHASNVTGALHPVARLGAIAKEYGIPFVLDGAQTAGHYPIDFQALSLSALAVPAHKGLLGPPGIGALLLAPAFAERLEPLIAGGTGSASDSEELPDYMPDRFESGTLNIPGIYGWLRSIEYVERNGVETLREAEMELAMRFLDGVREMHGVRVVGPLGLSERVGVVSLDFAGRDNAEIADALDQEYGIRTRCGLHCAPNAHKTAGTFPQGTVRFSFGPYNTARQIDSALNAIRYLLK